MDSAVTLAGRRDELKRLLQAVADEACGAVVITGEAGIGKSKLTAGLIAAVRGAGTLTLAGTCLRLSSSLSFLPVLDVLRELDEIDDGAFLRSLLATLPGYVRVELARLRPELSAAGDLALRPDTMQQQRLLEALRRLLSAAAALRPVVVVLEDVQWADAATLAFSSYLMAPSHGAGVTMILTARPEEVDDEWFVETIRSDRVRLLNLGLLSRDETGEQAALLRGRDVEDSEIDALYRRTRGHAFFTEQLVSTSPSPGGTDIPAGLRPVLLSRFTQQSTASRQMLSLLAIAAQPMAEDTLRAIRGWSIEQTRGTLYELVAARLVIHDERHYSLRHALIGDAIRSELLPGELQTLHTAVATALAATDCDRFPGVIALHWAAAGNYEQELSWRLRAAEYADRLNMAAEAAAHWDRAVELCDSSDRTPPGRTRTDVYLRCSWAYEHLGRGQEAADRAELALSALTEDATAAERATTYRVVGQWRSLDHLDEGIALLRAAVELCRDLPPGRDHGLAAHGLVQLQLQQRGQVDAEQIALIDEAIRVSAAANAHGLQRLLGAASAFARLMLGDRDGAIAAAEAADANPRDPRDPQSTIGAASYIVDVLAACGAFERAANLGRAELDWIDDNGYPTAPTSTALRARVTIDLYRLGRLDEAVNQFRGRPGHAIPSLIRRYVDRASGNESSTSGSTTAATAPLDTAGAPDPLVAAISVESLLWTGIPTDIEAAAGEALRSLTAAAHTVRSKFAGGLLTLSIRACADLAGLARRSDRPAGLRAAISLADQFAVLAAECKFDPFSDEALATARADALMWRSENARLAGSDRAEQWDSAATEWLALGLPFSAAYARFRQAEAILARPRRHAAAASVLRQAAELAGEHRPLGRMIDDLARRARIQTTSVDTAPTTRRAADADTAPFGLTTRELAVLMEIGAGRTNAQIAHSLFISRSTAGVHVSNVLRKLHVTSRVQAAAVAADLGLLAPTRDR